jgi:hypothetical protein
MLPRPSTSIRRELPSSVISSVPGNAFGSPVTRTGPGEGLVRRVGEGTAWREGLEWG